MTNNNDILFINIIIIKCVCILYIQKFVVSRLFLNVFESLLCSPTL